MQVTNMTNNKGNKVVNQFIITDGNKTYFQSYSSIIAVKNNGVIKLDKHYWDYSSMTGKFRNIFLGENITETRRKIKNKTYKLVNLNK